MVDESYLELGVWTLAGITTAIIGGKRELTNEFKTWFQENEGGGKPPKGKELYEYMDKIYGKAKTTGWHGLEIVYADQEDDIDEVGNELE